MSHLTAQHLKDLHRFSREEAQKLALSPYYAWMANQPGAFTKYKKASTAAEEPQIPNPALFKGLDASPPASDASIPTVAECAVHLELLEVFRRLRTSIINSTELDTTFGVIIDNKKVFRKEYDFTQGKHVPKEYKLNDKTWKARRKEKWSYFLTLAVARFRGWMRKLDAALAASKREEQKRVEGESSKAIEMSPETDTLEIPYLPPLDILMVWHGFLLNPLDFKKWCIKVENRFIYDFPFPWSRIHQAINSRDWSFKISDSNAAWTQTTAVMAPDFFQYLVEAGKKPGHVATTLARYGARHYKILTVGQLMDMPDLTREERAFLNMVQVSGIVREGNDLPMIENVQRQAAFVDKMHAQLWIRSPAAEGTLARAIDRYDKFLQLLKLYPGKMLVPTLDIDIVWHTHQCSAASYKRAMETRTGRFINHDDKIGQTTLSGGMDETKQLFMVRFGVEYNVCLCWDCMATESAIKALNPDGGRDVDEAESKRVLSQVEKDVDYYRCVELARRNAQGLLPVRG